MACKWDYYLSNYLFKQYCTDRAGLFVYEKVQLGDEYFMPFPKNKDPRDLDPRFIIDDNLMINRKRFDQDFILYYYKHILVSSMGPISADETSIIRKTDQKVLGKAVSFNNGKGWWYREIESLGEPTAKSCPVGYDDEGRSYAGLLHNNLINKIFFVTLK